VIKLTVSVTQSLFNIVDDSRLTRKNDKGKFSRSCRDRYLEPGLIFSWNGGFDFPRPGLCSRDVLSSLLLESATGLRLQMARDLVIGVTITSSNFPIFGAHDQYNGVEVDYNDR
jgi:hypothetical protein